jgi:hypothetical protein
MNHQELLSAVDYDPVTGIFTRKVAAGNTKAGSVIGNPTKKGYLKALVLGKYVTLHRLAWFFVHGEWPEQAIDHKNTIKTDNRLDNLRDCSTSVNCLNQRDPRINNALGLHGVHQIKKTGRYRASCTINGKKTHLGVFATPEEASQAYKAFKAPLLPPTTP